MKLRLPHALWIGERSRIYVMIHTQSKSTIRAMARIGPSAFLKCALHGGICSERSYELNDRVSLAATKEAYRNALNRIVEGTRSQPVAEEALKNLGCRLQVEDRDTDMVKGKCAHRRFYYG